MNENAIIRSVPAAKTLNQVPGFDPLKYLKIKISPKTGEKEAGLDLNIKKRWFKLAMPYGKMVHNVIRVTDQIAIIEAKVFAHRNDACPLSSCTVTKHASEVPGGRYIRLAQDESLDQALTNAGFGIQLCDVIHTSAQSESKFPVPHEKPAFDHMPVVGRNIPVQPLNEDAAPSDVSFNNGVSPTAFAPLEFTENEVVPIPTSIIPPATTEEAGSMGAITVSKNVPLESPEAIASMDNTDDTDAANNTQAPTAPEEPIVTAESTANVVMPFPEVIEDAPPCTSYTADMSVDEICQIMSLDDARSLVVDIGTCKGWTLQQVSERRPPLLKFYVRGVSEANNILKAAATLLLDDKEQKKAG